MEDIEKQKPVGSNNAQKKLRAFRVTAESDIQPANERMIACRKILNQFGATDRNVPIIRKVVKLFEKDSDIVIREQALKLKLLLEKKILLAEARKRDVDITKDPVPPCECPPGYRWQWRRLENLEVQWRIIPIQLAPAA